MAFYNSNNITMCNDGKYRWVYELNLYKSKTPERSLNL